MISSFWVMFIVFFQVYLNFNFLFLVIKFLKKVCFSGVVIKRQNLKIWVVFMWCFFIFIVFRKIVGLIPYVYGVTTNFYFVLFFSFWGWIRLIFSSFFLNFQRFIAHFCPRGAPNMLGWFLRIVEVVRVRIRPGTLTLRLVAKMTTGHILIGLITLSNCYLFFKNFIVGFFCSLFLLFYILFEVAICYIQGTVFFMLFQSYTLEHL